jgi:hypothetical protein
MLPNITQRLETGQGSSRSLVRLCFVSGFEGIPEAVHFLRMCVCVCACVCVCGLWWLVLVEWHDGTTDDGHEQGWRAGFGLSIIYKVVWSSVVHWNRWGLGNNSVDGRE